MNIHAAVTKAINDAIAKLPKEGMKEAVNWANLRCVDVWCNDDEVLAEVSEAAPGCSALSAYLEAAAIEATGRRVRVITSW